MSIQLFELNNKPLLHVVARVYYFVSISVCLLLNKGAFSVAPSVDSFFTAIPKLLSSYSQRMKCCNTLVEQ